MGLYTSQERKFPSIFIQVAVDLTLELEPQEKGVVGAMKKGVYAAYPIVDVKVELLDGSYHDVDSSDLAFRVAGSKAFREGISKAGPVLLEPVMDIEIVLPMEYIGYQCLH